MTCPRCEPLRKALEKVYLSGYLPPEGIREIGNVLYGPDALAAPAPPRRVDQAVPHCPSCKSEGEPESDGRHTCTHEWHRTHPAPPRSGLPEDLEGKCLARRWDGPICFLPQGHEGEHWIVPSPPVEEPVELDSPNFVPPEQAELARRQYKRVNRHPSPPVEASEKREAEEDWSAARRDFERSVYEEADRDDASPPAGGTGEKCLHPLDCRTRRTDGGSFVPDQNGFWCAKCGRDVSEPDPPKSAGEKP